MLAKVPVQPNQTPKHTLFTQFQMDVKVGQSGQNICPTRQDKDIEGPDLI